MGGSHWGRWYDRILFSLGASMVLGGVAQMLARKPELPVHRQRITVSRTPISLTG